MHEFSEVITSVDALRRVIGHPGPRVSRKVIPALDGHCRTFIARSPMAILTTSDRRGRIDVSPKGDAPGFARVLDDTTLAIPDRPGNRRADGLLNLLEQPRAGLLFLVPGYAETLRVSGGARIVRDASLRESMAVDGRPPALAIVVDVEEAFFHCGKCTLRASLWDPSGWPEISDLPDYAEIAVDHARWHESPDAVAREIRGAYESDLY